MPSETFITKEIETFRSYGAEIDVYPLIKKYTPAYFARCKKLKNTKYDAVVAHFFSAPTRAAYRHFKDTDIPFIISCHAFDIYKNRTSEKLQHKILTRADMVVTCCKGNVDYLKAKFPNFADKMHLFYHGVKVKDGVQPKHDFLRDNKLRLLFIGRIVEKKGLPEFINFLGEVREKLTRDVEFTVIGSGKGKKEVVKAISNSGINDMVNILPFMKQDELKQYYMSADMFVFPSIITPSGDRDGLANVILEAFSFGLPVLATAVNGTVDAVKDGETGFIMDYDDPDYIVNILNNITVEELSNVAKAAFLTVSTKFNHDTCLRSFWDNITKVL